MPNSSMPWVKIYSEFIHDPKIGRLPPTAQLLFVKLIIVAGEMDADGYLINGEDAMTPQDLAWHMHIDEAQLISDLELLKSAKLISLEDDYLFVINFAKRQGRPQSEKREMWRQRKARSRGKPNLGAGDGAGIARESRGTAVGTDDSHAGVTLPEERRGEKRREEESSDADASGAPHQSDFTPTPIPPRNNSKARPRDLLFDAVAEVTISNPQLQGSRIAKTTNALRKIGATPEQVKKVAAWYTANDWRGKKGEKLTLSLLTEVWDMGIKGVVIASPNGARPPAQSAGEIAIQRAVEKYTNG